MPSKTGQQAVLVVLIGWSRKYDGTEEIIGGHAYLQHRPDSNGEMEAFVRQPNGYFRCGAGKGAIQEKNPDILFIARNPMTSQHEIVALYRSCQWEVDEKDNWCTVQTTSTTCFPVGVRPACNDWPIGQGMRRWARRVSSKGTVWPDLLAAYRVAVSKKIAGKSAAIDVDIELSAFEGESRTRFIRHRRREASLRAAKIREATRLGQGHLVCEVPGCGFDFLKVYGEVGRNFAVVHHREPLSRAPQKGAKTMLSDLAIVCANCHLIIHRGGECRGLTDLIE